MGQAGGVATGIVGSWPWLGAGADESASPPSSPPPHMPPPSNLDGAWKTGTGLLATSLDTSGGFAADAASRLGWAFYGKDLNTPKGDQAAAAGIRSEIYPKSHKPVERHKVPTAFMLAAIAAVAWAILVTRRRVLQPRGNTLQKHEDDVSNMTML